MNKQCPKCKEVKPLTREYWHIKADCRDGFRATCSECYNEYAREYKRDHPQEDPGPRERIVSQPWSALAAAVIIQAARDIKSRDVSEKVKREAREWLRSDGCRFICDSLDFSHDGIVRWLEAGCRGGRKINEMGGAQALIGDRRKIRI